MNIIITRAILPLVVNDLKIATTHNNRILV